MTNNRNAYQHRNNYYYYYDDRSFVTSPLENNGYTHDRLSDINIKIYILLLFAGEHKSSKQHDLSMIVNEH